MDGIRDLYIYFIVDYLLYDVVYLATDTFHYIISRTLDSLGATAGSGRLGTSRTHAKSADLRIGRVITRAGERL
jgi:hypothetical protein